MISRTNVAVIAITAVATITTVVVGRFGQRRLLGPAALFRGLRHRRRLGHGFRHRHHEVADHRVAEAERAGEFVERLLVALDVHQHVVGLVDLGDRERELATAPVFEAMDRAAARGDHAAVALDHGRDLLALVRVDQEHDFVMTHVCAPFGYATRRQKHGAARSCNHPAATGPSGAA